MDPPDRGGAVRDSEDAWLFDSFGDKGSGQADTWYFGGGEFEEIQSEPSDDVLGRAMHNTM